MVADNQEIMGAVTSFQDVEHLTKEGKIAALLAIEGGDALGGGIATLRMFYRLGVRCLALTWNHRNQLADGVAEAATNGGLTAFGQQVVTEMNRLGMLVDVAHLAPAGFWDVLRLSQAPVIVSHANCRALHDHRRNLTDSQIKELAAHGGVMGVTFVPQFLSGGEADLCHVLDHIDHVCQLVGTDYVGLGSDFDGAKHTAQGLEDVSCYSKITKGLLDRGYASHAVAKILGGNWLRVMQQVI